MGKLLEAVQNDDRRVALTALRDEIARAIEDTTSGRDKAALVIKLIDIMDRLDAQPDPNAGRNPAQSAREMVRKNDGQA